MACTKRQRALRVFVYRNLNLPGKVFSIRDLDSGRVIAHTEGCLLLDARFRVSEPGRQRVLRQKRKNVHAGVEGTLVLDPAIIVRARRRLKRQVGYDPYVSPFFSDINGAQVTEAAAVLFDKGKVYV